MTRPAGCDQFRFSRPTRRHALQFGLGGMLALGLPELGRLEAAGSGSTDRAGTAVPVSSFGRARACILIFQWGGPSQLETWDPKPHAPAEIRGSFQAIATRTPGLILGEHFPLIAQRTDRLAVIHSMTHDDPAHLSTAHRVFTGHLAPVVKSDAIGPSPRDWPHLGAILARLKPAEATLPTAVSMPWSVSHPAAPGGRAPGQHGGWLGKAFDPMPIDGDPNSPTFAVPGLALPEGLSVERIQGRRALFANTRAAESAAPGWDRFQHQAFDTLLSAESRGAFAIVQEDPRLRERYGRHIHGQCLLLARRLVEAGVRLVTVNWHDDGRNFWDTHGDNFNRLKNDLMPPADQGFAALLDDLAARNLLDTTLVVWVGEFGRAPRITAANAGREHWPRCYSAALAGAGVRGGTVYGSSDRWAAYPASQPTSPEDVGATILHALGVDPGTMIHDALNRPMRINEGNPILGLFG